MKIGNIVTDKRDGTGRPGMVSSVSSDGRHVQIDDGSPKWVEYLRLAKTGELNVIHTDPIYQLYDGQELIASDKVRATIDRIATQNAYVPIKISHLMKLIDHVDIGPVMRLLDEIDRTTGPFAVMNDDGRWFTGDDDFSADPEQALPRHTIRAARATVNRVGGSVVPYPDAIKYVQQFGRAKR